MGNCPAGSQTPRTLKAPYDNTLDQMAYLVTQQLNASGYSAPVNLIQAAMCDALDNYSEWVSVVQSNATAQALAQTVGLAMVEAGTATPLPTAVAANAATAAAAAASGSTVLPSAASAAGPTVSSLLSNPIVLLGGAGVLLILLLPPRGGKRR